MAGDDGDVVGQGEKTLVNGAQEFAGVAAGQVGTTDGAGEKGVTG